MKKKIIILGATGSIGKSTLHIVKKFKDRFDIVGVSAHQNEESMREICAQFEPKNVIFTNRKLEKTFDKFSYDGCSNFYFGSESFSDFLNIDFDLLVNGISGFDGILPTFLAIEMGKDIAIANKESIVSGGNILIERASQTGSKIIPIDSEHNALLQIIKNYNLNDINKITLTASGGPFRKDTFDTLINRKISEALNHPTWRMGPKNTIDSATLMNKGLEVIEAKWLFNLSKEQIDVVVHPQSIIHSAVQFEDGSIKVQLGIPDMKLPIQYALGFPNRLKNNFKRFSFFDYPNLTFEKADEKTFRNLSLAYRAMEKGGNSACILNAANEIAVDAFLNDKIGFLNMSDLIDNCLEKITFVKSPTIEDYIETDQQTRLLANKLL